MAGVLADLMTDVGRIVSGAAAAVFGFVVGYVLTGVAVWLLFRVTYKEQPPRPARR